MSKIKKFIGGLVASVSALTLVSAPVLALTSTVVVTGNTSSGVNQPGWLFNRDTANDTPYEFNTDEQSIGSGSLYVEPIGLNAADKFIGENFILSPVSNVSTISYDFMIGAGGVNADADQFYMNVYANFGESSPTKFYDCRYDVVPTTGSTSSFTTMTFDTSLTYPVTTRGGASPSPYTCPSSPSAMQAMSTSGTATIRMFSLNVGDTGASDNGLDGYLDNVVVNTVTDITTYDFEPILTPQTKDECKKDGWKTFNTPTFKNQGACVSFVATSGNPLAILFRRIF